jgi:hypothetical protein
MVNMRSIMVSAALFIALCFSAYLISTESVLPDEAQIQHVTTRSDVLQSILYTKPNRAKNLSKFGFTELMVKQALDKMRRIEDKHDRKLTLLLEQAPEPTTLIDALCGQTAGVRPRYGALRFLVIEEQGVRQPINISRITRLEVQDWSQLAPITDVFRHVELSENRQDDATVMAIAGIIEKKEDDILKNFEPWGRGLLPGAWSWKGVVKQHRGVSKSMVDYFSVMHLLVERATADDGVCGEEEE